MKGVDPASLYVTDAVARLERGAVRAAGYADACLRRIDEHEEGVRAWQAVDPELVRQQARDLDAHRLSARPTGPLHGVPVGVQDIFDTAGLPTANGLDVEARRRPERDAAAVARLRAAGAVILGKTATTALADTGPCITHHPADARRAAGGAAAGAAAAVASGMAPLALAMQTSGEIIRAASYCGVVGFKPSHGLVSCGGALPRSATLDTVGVLGACVEDVALAVDALAGYDGDDPQMQPSPPPRALELARSEPPLAPSFAYVPQSGWAVPDAATAEGFAELGAVLGDRWDTVEFPDTFTDGIGAHRTLLLVDVAHNLGHYRDRYGDRLPDAPRTAIDEGRGIPAINYLSALDWRRILHTGVQRIFDRYEVIATPATPGEAPAAGEPVDNAAFCVLWTLLGLPVISLPLLEGPDGRPVGVQLVGRHGHDGRLLRTARYLCEFIAGRE